MFLERNRGRFPFDCRGQFPLYYALPLPFAPRARRCALLWLGPNPSAVSIELLDLEDAGMAYEVAQFGEAIAAGVEVRHQVDQLRSDEIQPYPALVAFNLRNRCFQQRNGGAGWLQ